MLVWFTSRSEPSIELAKQTPIPVTQTTDPVTGTALQKFPFEIGTAVISSFEETGHTALPLSEA